MPHLLRYPPLHSRFAASCGSPASHSFSFARALVLSRDMPSVLHGRSLAPFTALRPVHYEAARSASSGGVSSILIVGLAILGVLIVVLVAGATHYLIKRRRVRAAESDGPVDLSLQYAPLHPVLLVWICSPSSHLSGPRKLSLAMDSAEPTLTPRLLCHELALPANLSTTRYKTAVR